MINPLGSGRLRSSANQKKSHTNAGNRPPITAAGAKVKIDPVTASIIT